MRKWLLGLLVVASLQAEPFTDSLFKWSKKADLHEVHHYPYSDLSDRLRKQGVESVKIFSYGSLMNPESAKRTLSKKTVMSLELALAFGVKRSFDRDVPIKPNSRWGVPENKMARGMLNIRKTGCPIDMVNGVIFDVSLDELDHILDREEGYDLVPVVVMKWNDSLNSDAHEFFIAYTFRAKVDGEYTSSDILPRPGYYELTRDAAKVHGPLFYMLWLRTTYFADGKRPIILWEQK